MLGRREPVVATDEPADPRLVGDRDPEHLERRLGHVEVGRLDRAVAAVDRGRAEDAVRDVAAEWLAVAHPYVEPGHDTGLRIGRIEVAGGRWGEDAEVARPGLVLTRGV